LLNPNSLNLDEYTHANRAAAMGCLPHVRFHSAPARCRRALRSGAFPQEREDAGDETAGAEDGLEAKLKNFLNVPGNLNRESTR
jgi:hypothetical protein